MAKHPWNNLFDCGFFINSANGKDTIVAMVVGNSIITNSEITDFYKEFHKGNPFNPWEFAIILDQSKDFIAHRSRYYGLPDNAQIISCIEQCLDRAQGPIFNFWFASNFASNNNALFETLTRGLLGKIYSINRLGSSALDGKLLGLSVNQAAFLLSRY